MSIIINGIGNAGLQNTGLGNFRRNTGFTGNTGRPPRAAAPEENKPCPPTSTPDEDDVFNGGEEVLDTVEYPDISFPEFLAPIEQVDVTQHQHLATIREINIFDQNFFLRTNSNLFSLDANGNEIIQVPGFHSQTDVMYKYPRIRNGFNYIENDLVEFLETGIDEFRVDNNRFWCLNGVETNPIEERWADSSTRESLRNRYYNFTLEPLDFSARSLRGIGYPIKKSNIIIQFQTIENSGELSSDTRLEVAQNLFGVATENTFFEDFNTSIKQPLTEDEISQLEEPSLANGCYSINFNTVIGSREVDQDLLSEHLMPSLYREYFRLETQKDDDCDIDERVQKFLCSHIDHIDIANSTQALRDRHQNFIEISIGRPKPIGHQIIGTFPKLETILDNFAVSELDKYLLEQITGFGGVYQKKQFIQITDEKTPGQVQAARPNDQFSLGMLNVTKQDFTDLIHNFNNSEESRNSAIENVMMKVRQYPLRFTDYNNRETLTLNDTDGMINFEDRINLINSQVSRTYDQILSGAKAPSYILGYIVEKYNSTDPTPIQVFMIMERPQDIEDTSNHQPIKFIDTQVKYGKSYRYRIYSISLVYGTEYAYDNLSNKTPGVDNAATAEVQYSDFSKIVLAPFYQKVVSMSDLPPLPPEPTFVPYQGVSNKIRITLNHSVGSRKENPISITSQDQSIISSMRGSQEESQDGKIHYLSDTIPTSYEVFMSTSRPRSYASFGRTARSITLQTEGKLTAIFESENIVPNLNYYFTFRSKELAGISNPSPVYRMRMVDTPNGIFMDLQEYDMYSAETTYTKLSFQRALKISPALHQKSITYPEGTDLSSREFALRAPHLTEITPLGPDTKAIWDKKYKFRISSKSTCKKIDLNITFKQNTDQIEPVFTKPGDCDPILPGDPPEPRRFSDPDPVDCFVRAPIPVFENVFQGMNSTTRVNVSCGQGSVQVSRRGTDAIKYKLDFGKPFEIADPDTLGPISFEQWLQKLGELENFVVASGDEISLRTERSRINTSNTRVRIRTQGKLKELLACPDDESKIIDFLPKAVYEQKEKADSGSDYRAVLETDGHVPPHLLDDIQTDIEQQLLLNNIGTGMTAQRHRFFTQTHEEMVNVEQKVYWTKAYQVAGDLREEVDLRLDREASDLNPNRGNAEDILESRNILLETEWKASIHPQQFTALNLIRSIMARFISYKPNGAQGGFFPRASFRRGASREERLLNDGELSVAYGSRTSIQGIDLEETNQMFAGIKKASIFIPAKLWPKAFFDAALRHMESRATGPGSFSEVSIEDKRRICQEAGGDFTWNEELQRCEKVCRDFTDDEGTQFTSRLDPDNPCVCIDTPVVVTSDDKEDEKKEEEPKPTQLLCFVHGVNIEGNLDAEGNETTMAVPVNPEDPNSRNFLAQEKICRYRGAILINHTSQCPGCTETAQHLRMALDIEFIFEYEIDIISQNDETIQKGQLVTAIEEFRLRMQDMVEQAEATAGFGDDVIYNEGQATEVNISAEIRKRRNTACKVPQCPDGQFLDPKDCKCKPVADDTPRLPEIEIFDIPDLGPIGDGCSKITGPKYFIQVGIAGKLKGKFDPSRRHPVTRADIIWGPEFEITAENVRFAKANANSFGRQPYEWIHYYMAGRAQSWDSGFWADRHDFIAGRFDGPDKAIKEGIHVFYGMFNYPTTFFASDSSELKLDGFASISLDQLPGERNPRPETTTFSQIGEQELALAQQQDNLVTGIRLGGSVQSLLGADEGGAVEISPDLQIFISRDLEEYSHDLVDGIAASSAQTLEEDVGLRDETGVDGLIVRQGLKFRDAFWFRGIQMFKEDYTTLDQQFREEQRGEDIFGNPGRHMIEGREQARVKMVSGGDFSMEDKSSDPVGVYTVKITRTGTRTSPTGERVKGKETDVVLVFPKDRAPVKYIPATLTQELSNMSVVPAALGKFLNDSRTGSVPSNRDTFDESVLVLGTNQPAPDFEFRAKYGISPDAKLSMYGIHSTNRAVWAQIAFAIDHFVNFDVEVCND